MTMVISVTMDSADAARLAEFWKLALGYEDEPPPAPFTTRQEWLDSFPDDGEDDGLGGAWLHDPAGVGPRLSILDVPEPKVAKNRLHLDVRVSGQGDPAQRWPRIAIWSDRLIDAGATVLQVFDGHHISMADPEGNEFCVA
ncbi:MAG: VOC family protein [Nakamurella sp.]